MWDPSSLSRDRTRVPCIRKQILNQWTTREVPIWRILTKNPSDPSAGRTVSHFTAETDAGLQSVSKPKTRFKNGSNRRLWVAAWPGTLFSGAIYVKMKNLPFDSAFIPPIHDICTLTTRIPQGESLWWTGQTLEMTSITVQCQWPASNARQYEMLQKILLVHPYEKVLYHSERAWSRFTHAST